MASETVTDMKGNIVKMEVDYTETCDKKLPELEQIAKVCNYYSLKLLSYEKVDFLLI